MYETIAMNTNKYAVAQGALSKAPQDKPHNHTRIWRPTTADEIRVFFGICIYMGVHQEKRYTIYWEKIQAEGPRHSIQQRMSLRRYEALRKYIHLSEPDQLPPEPRNPAEEELLPTETMEKLWWWKVEPLLSHFRNACKAYYMPRNDVAIDEIMVRFFGRSYHTYKMPGKPIKQGFKIFALADQGYVLIIQLTSRTHGIGQLLLNENLTPTGSMVLQMARQLPKISGSPFTIFLDNYFTSIPLFRKLRKENIGACGTTRAGAAGKDFPAILTVLRESYSKKLDWGTICAIPVDDVLCVGWQDNNLVLGLTTVHTVDRAEDEVTRWRRRPAKTSTNAATARKVFGDLARVELDIPVFIDDYNGNMNGVDLANQHREAYDTQRIAYRVWWPIFHWILDQAVINAYKLAKVNGTWKSDHLAFRRNLYNQLLRFADSTPAASLCEYLSNRRLDPGPHEWIRLQTRKICVWCRYIAGTKRKVIATLSATTTQTAATRHILGDITNSGGNKRLNACWNGCKHCGVPLCKMGDCWVKYHAP